MQIGTWTTLRPFARRLVKIRSKHGARVETACVGQTVVEQGVVVQAKALSLSLTYNVDIACL